MTVPPFGRHKSRPLVGWWSMHEDREALIRRDGASVRFLGFFDQDALAPEEFETGRRWMRFEANDTKRCMQVSVQWRDVFSPSRQRSLIWRLDYARSFKASDLAELGHNEWVAFDRFICDALTCWPEREATGLRPSLLAVTGGWHEGRWQDKYYRTFEMAFLRSAADVDLGSVPVVVDRIEDAREWHFVPPTQIVTAEDILDTQETLSDAARDDLRALVTKLLPSRPHLRSGDRFFFPLFPGRFRRSPWVYMDDEIITDCITLSTDEPDWYLNVENGRDSVIGAISRNMGTSNSLEYAPRSGHGRKMPVKLSRNFLERFQELCRNGIWLWEDTYIHSSHPAFDSHGRSNAIHIPKPEWIRIDGIISVAGTDRTKRLQVATTLERDSFNAEEMSYAFREDTFVSRIALSELFEFHPVSRCLTDRASGQRLELHEIISGNRNVTDQCAGIYRYRDGDTDYFFNVTRENRRKNYVAGIWIVDHNSSRLKKQQSKGQSISNEMWYRMANFIRDAILFWPDDTIFGASPSSVVETGGVFQGRWEARLRRQQSYGLNTFEPDRSDCKFADASALLHPWKIFEPATDTTIISDKIKRAISKAESGVLDPLSRPSAKPLSCLRLDGRAILHHCGWKSLHAPPDGDIYQVPIFEYVDDDVTARWYPRLPGRFETASVAVIAVDPLSAFQGELEPIPPSHSDPTPSWYPNREVWLRLVSALEAQLDYQTGSLEIKGLFTSHGYDSHAVRNTWLEEL
ncbi:hypothetical protein ACSV9I_07860 [Rhizobium sp. G187]|uniref:hypothetical protein n=1 Tax=Rhizobium sp. G187 TaxID=3451352 RepID=UPI003EE7BCF0